MAPMKDMWQQMIEKMVDQATEIALLKEQAKVREKLVTALDNCFKEEQEHRNQTALRNQTLQLRCDQFAERMERGEQLLERIFHLSVTYDYNDRECYSLQDVQPIKEAIEAFLCPGQLDAVELYPVQNGASNGG